MVPPDRRRFYVNWQSASQQAAIMSLRCVARLPAKQDAGNGRYRRLGLAHLVLYRLLDHSGDVRAPAFTAGDQGI